MATPNLQPTVPPDSKALEAWMYFQVKVFEVQMQMVYYASHGMSAQGLSLEKGEIILGGVLGRLRRLSARNALRRNCCCKLLTYYTPHNCFELLLTPRADAEEAWRAEGRR